MVADDEREAAGGHMLAQQVELAHMHAFQRRHARVGLQPGVQLPVTDVHADDMPCAVSQQAVGEAAGALADVQHRVARHG